MSATGYRETESSVTAAYKVEILSILARYRFLTSRQIWEKSGLLAGKSYSQTRVELARLKKMRLVRSLTVENEKGRASPHQWVLSPAGAKLAGLPTCPNYGGSRHPSRLRIRQQAMLLELEEQVTLAGAGWRLVLPATGRLKPDPAEQYHRLVAALNFREYRETGKWPANPYGPHTLGIPLRSSDYLAYSQPGGEFAVVLILCPQGSGRKFVGSRIEKYRAITGRVPVVMLFSEERLSRLHRSLLVKHGLLALEIKLLADFLVSIF
ncbi:MAG TPA: replication-relaxation family protein [Chloroflexia bacterium]|nr:replication-relaxation family protein [Chloroflexia bacterium]